MSLHLSFEPHSWYRGFAIKKNENNTVCSYRPLDADTDGTEWFECVHHGAEAPSMDAPCANYDESAWSAYTDDGDTMRVVQLNADTLEKLKFAISDWREANDEKMRRRYATK